MGSGACSSQRQRRSAQPGERRAEQGDPPGALGSQQPHLDRDPPAHAVADQVGALDLQLVEQGLDRSRRSRARRRRRRAACRNRRTRAGRSRSPDGGRRARRRWGGRRPWSRRARARRSPGRPRPRRASRSCRRRVSDGVEAKPTLVGDGAGGGEEADAEVEVLADAQAAARGRRPFHRARRGRSAPRWPRRRSAGRRAGASLAGCSSIAPASITASHSPSPSTARRMRAEPLGTSITSGSKRSIRAVSPAGGPLSPVFRSSVSTLAMRRVLVGRRCARAQGSIGQGRPRRRLEGA